jgi:hypothetical protein
MPCFWEQFRFCHKTSQAMNTRPEVFEVYLDADWRSRETRDELVAACCFFARTSQRATYEPTWDSVDKAPYTCLV